MNSRTLDFAQQIKDLTQGQGLDLVFNSLSGDFIPESLKLLKPQGRFVEIGKRDVLTTSQVAEIKPEVEYFLVDLMAIAHQTPEQIQSLLHKILHEFETERLQPLPHRVFAATESVSAFRLMQQAKHIGKIVLEFEAINPITISDTATYLITGGLGGLGLEVAQWLVQQGARHLLLVNRRAICDRSESEQQLINASLNAMQEAGADVRCKSVDVSQTEDLAQLIQAIPQHQPLRGIIHAAGVLDDGVVEQMTSEKLQHVLKPKVQGAWNLHQLTLSDKATTSHLDFFVLFSSAASLLGSPGQANHVAANTFLDTLAQFRRCQGLPALSINWGAWSEIGSALSNKADLQRLGIGEITPQDGIAVLEKLFQSPLLAQMGVIPIRWEQLQSGLAGDRFQADPFFSNLIQQGSEPEPMATTENWFSQLEVLPDRKREPFLQKAIQSEVAKVLGLPRSQRPEVKAGFFDLGMDSLMAVELQNRIQTELAIKVSSTVIFEFSTIQDLSTHLLQLIFEPTLTESPPKIASPPGETHSLEDELAALERLLE